jgi:acylphosphatase
VKHLSIIVSGKVQGVFFRASAKEAAEKLGITGFARNEKDGSVYIEAEGADEQLEQFVVWCNHGPSNAVVKNIIVEEGKVLGFVKFEVRR